MPIALDHRLAGLPDALAGEFELETELGRGGMGVVFRARDIRLDRQVALKVLPPDIASDTETRGRFLREARTAGQLSHPHIVHIHRADERGAFAFFVMGLVDGENLGQRVRDRGPLPPAEAVRHLREVAWALAYAHARGVVHRDVKPENIMIERGTNRALVTDFGIARTERSASLTSEGHVVGTAHYMSPEQVQGGALDGRSDLYALGCVGYYLLSGRVPFEGEAASAVLVAHVTRTAPPLLSVAPNVPRALAAVIERCLAKDPSARFATGEDLAEELRRAIEGAVAARAPEVVSGAHRLLSEDAAALVWRRAAQLQAEAAARLERETRAHAARALGTDVAAAGTAPASSGAAPTSTYRLQDVEAAAVEAGISQRFVALALSELPQDAGAIAAAVDDGSARERVGRMMLGGLQRSLSVSRIVRAPAREVLKSIGRTFQGMPFKLTLADQIGAHPLDGGILVFRLSTIDWSGQTTYPFNWLRYGLGATQLRATLRPLDTDSGATEVTIVADLRPGLDASVWSYAGLSAGATLTASGIGALVAAKGLAIAGAMLAAPIAITGVAAAALSISLSRATYRWGIRAATKEMEELLHSIEGTMRSRAIFDDDAPLIAPGR